VFLVVAAFLSLDVYEKSLLESLEHALSQQARVIAAWLGEGELTSGSASGAITALRKEHTARIRVIDARGGLLADSSAADAAPQAKDAPAAEKPRSVRAEEPSPESSFLYRALSAPVRVAKRWFLPPQPPIGVADALAAVNGRLDGPEVRAALSGSYGSATRISAGGQVSVTLYSAVPIRSRGVIGAPRGAVILSQSTFRILQSLYALRVRVGGVFLAGLAAAIPRAIAVSLFFTGPLRSLARQARAATARGAPGGGHFSPPGPGVEANELFEALSEYSSRLGERIGWAERFAQDASHELRNPIASVRAAAEYLLDRVEGGLTAADARERLESVMADAMRMDRIIRGLRRLSRLDADPGDYEPAEALSLVRNLASRMAQDRPEAIEVRSNGVAEGIRVGMDGERFILALEPVIENALSFNPAGSPVIITCEVHSNSLYINVLDSGPGIPGEHRSKVFDRFFSYRPANKMADAHSGLGLSIAKAVMDAAGGSIAASNREGGGASFTLAFPLASERSEKARKRQQRSKRDR